MSFMALVLFAPVLTFQFPLLNLCVRDGNDARCQPFETFKGRFLAITLHVLHVVQYAYSGAGSNVALRRLIVRGSMESIIPLTLNRLFFSTKRNCSFPLVGTEILISGIADRGSAKYATVNLLLIRLAPLNNSNQSTDTPTKAFFVSSFSEEKISESIFSMICLGLKVGGPKDGVGRGFGVDEADGFSTTAFGGGVGIGLGFLMATRSSTVVLTGFFHSADSHKQQPAVTVRIPAIQTKKIVTDLLGEP
jgi:hypothetical protein